MSRTYRKSSIDVRYSVTRRERWKDEPWMIKKNYDGNGDTGSQNFKWFLRKGRRSNDRKIINDFLRGVDPDNFDYPDDHHLKYLKWIFY